MNSGGGPYRRDIGTLGAIFLVVNSMIGAGIFALPETLHSAVGTFAPWLLVLAGLGMGSVALCYARLSSLTERSGGPQRYVTDAFGLLAGFEAGWLFYFGRMLTQAANTTVMVTYAAALWPTLDQSLLRALAIIAIIATLTIINIVGIRRAVAVLAVLTLFKLAPLLILAVVGLANLESTAPVVLPELSSIETIALAGLYAFTGIENATVPAGEARDPRRSLPRAIMISLPLITAIYFMLQFIYSHSPIAGTGAKAPLAELAGHYGGQLGMLLITATVVVSVLANLAAGHTTSSRVTSAMAEDRLLPAWFGRVSRWGTPANSIVFFGAGTLLFALTGSFVTLAVAATLARLLVYIASISSLPLLRAQQALRPIAGTLFVVVPMGLAISLWAAAQSSRQHWLLIAAFVLVGTLLFSLARWKEVKA